MKKSFLILVLFFSTFIFAQSQNLSSDSSYLKYCVFALSADSMGGRLAGSEYEKKAADFIIQQFDKLKIIPFQKNSFKQQFEFIYDSVHYKSQNLIGLINNNAEKNIVICAHYDHIGFGGKLSRSYGKTEVHNGADDNASGVAAVLMLAKQLKKKNNKNYNYYFVAFGAHEPGLFGSEYFAASNLIKPEKIRIVINLDMVGRSENYNPVFFYSSTDSVFFNYTYLSEKNFIQLKETEMPKGDHTAFIDKKVPVIYLTSGTHDDYHKTSDDAYKINYKNLSLICRFMYDFIFKL